MPRLSVIIPAYNAATTVRAALRSTLRHLPRDAEVVVLDDGSTDGTLAVAEEFTDSRLRVHTAQNRGVSAALTALIEMTDSEIIARMDADDVVLPGRFDRQLDALAAGSDAVFTTVVSWSRGGIKLPWPSTISPEQFGMFLLLTNPVAHSTLCAKRAAITDVGGYRRLPTEDYDLWLRMANAGMKMRRLALPGLAYRVHPGQVTASEGWRGASWSDPNIAASFSTLANKLLGYDAKRITSLAVDPSLSVEEKREIFNEFARRFDGALLLHTPTARRALRRKLRDRRAWFDARLQKSLARL